ncbi:MAG: hypothetical protein CL917_08265 [Deltaproteobacteria bacterium]|nr:hypothetical protein [Deltaproteobacteria bacterium]
MMAPGSEAPPKRGLTRFLSGAQFLFEGIGFLRAERSLWPLALVPILLSAIALALMIFVWVSNAGEIQAWIDSFLPAVTVVHWYQWVWLGPAKLFLALLAWFIFLVLAALSGLFSLMLASLISAPFLDRLSWKVERIAEGVVMETDQSGLATLGGDIGRSLVAESKRVGFFLSIWVPLVVLGLLIPGAQIITGPLAVTLTVVLLPLQFCGYTLDRRRVTFKQRREWLFGDTARTLGFGGVAFVACFIPGLNVVMIPGLVTAGTLWVIRYPPESGL